MKKILTIICMLLIIVSCTQVKDKKADKSKKDSVKVEKNAAQGFIDVQKTHISKAKASVEKSNKAQDDQKKELDNLLGK